MYMLATLRGPPRPKGFRASAIGKKFTYGYKLHREKYSKALKALIWRCLCDKPKDRPDLRTLHKEIATALNAIKSRHTIAEQRLDPPEPRDPSKGPPPTTVPADAATGTRTAPFIVPGGVKVLRKMHFTFSVVPKHLPEGMQEPIWFRATPDSTLKQLKNTIRVDAGLKLTDDKQFIYMRVPGRPTILLDNMARMLSLYGVEQGVRLELWDSRKAHDEAEPDEPEFDVL
jgi:hypothetical protein